MSKYQISVLLKAIVGFNVVAETPEDALKIDRAQANKLQFINPKYEYIDGHEEIVGVTDDWELD